MDGPPCPVCKNDKERMWLLSTHNQWVYYCKTCDQRYNEKMEPKP